MKRLICLALFLGGCSVNANALGEDYVKGFAHAVRCAVGYKGACFCFVASRKTGEPHSTGIGMAIDHTGKLCE
jgi:hypothetical protein